MKRQLLLMGIVLGSGSMFAQSYVQAPLKSTLKNASTVNDKKNLTGNEILGALTTTPNPYVTQKNALFGQGFQIGTTYYDLQTNGSSRNGTIAYADNSVAAAFTFGNSAPSFADRGTGYNYMNTSSTWGAFSGAREEGSVRTGWPAIGVTSTGKEVILSHQGTTNGIHMLARNTKGTGTWSTDADIELKGLWPRMAISGNTIHVISIGDPDVDTAGLSTPLYYHRSTDGGATWAVSNAILPELDATSNFGWGGDGYAIDASGNNVAILIADSYNPTFLLKSTDGGSTWTKSIIIDPGLGNYGAQVLNSISDVNSDGIADTISSTDNSCAVIIDANGDAHAFFGLMRHLDDDPVLDAPSSYFPGTNGLGYWNELNPTTIDTITGALDTDGSGVLLDDYTAQGNIALYYQSLSSWPTVGIDASGTIYLAYSAVMEELNDNNDPLQFYRHMYIMKTSDNGATWSAPYYIPTQFPFGEYVFPMMARQVTSVIHLTCQKDGNPGLSVRGDLDAADLNEILYFQIPTSLPADLAVEEVLVNQSFSVFPNPANDNININLESANAGLATIQVIDITGKVVASQSATMNSGQNTQTLHVGKLNAGVYAVNVTINGKIHTSKFVKL